MSTRIISFQQLVEEADPDYYRGLTRPWIYEFSNGRLFYAIPNVYTYTGNLFILDQSVLDDGVLQ